MVVVKVVLVPEEECGTLDCLDELFASVGHVADEQDSAKVLPLAGTVLSCLIGGQGPAIVLDISLAPLLLREIWPRLWANARSSLSVRTLFGIESLDSVAPSSIVFVPIEMRARWQGQRLIDSTSAPDGPAARWLSGGLSPLFEGVMTSNRARLPGDFTALERVARIADRLDRMRSGNGTVTDALVVLRTQEAFSGGLVLPNEDIERLVRVLSSLENASIGDIRTASLVRLDAISDVNPIEAALIRWTETRLPAQSAEDAVWILEQQLSDAHAAWWRRAIARGVSDGCRARSRNWSTAIWRWWQARPDRVNMIVDRLDGTRETEQWLAADAPTNLSDGVVSVLGRVCHERDWSILLARTLGSNRALTDCVTILRENLTHPEAGLEILLAERSPAEVVDAAATTRWPPLVARAVPHTIANPQLLTRALAFKNLAPLLANHLSEGGVFPTELGRDEFHLGVFDGVLHENADCLKLVKHIGKDAARVVLDHPECEKLLQYVGSDAVQGAVEEWWRRFMADDSIGRPPSGLCVCVLRSARSHVYRSPVALVVSLLRLFPEIAETTLEDWMRDADFLWELGDHERLAALLVERKWRSATATLRWSSKNELKVVAWHARELLSRFNRFWTPPRGAEIGAISNPVARGAPKGTEIGIITIKEEEYEALLDKFAPSETAKGRNRDYDVATLTTTQGACRVAITRCLQQGNAHAQNAATELLSDVRPTFVLVVGIAGGVPTSDFCLGDVVVSDYFQDLTIEDSGAKSSTRRFNALGGPLHPSAARIVERLRAFERTASPWSEAGKIGVPRPKLDGQYTTDDKEWNAEIETALQRHSSRTGPIATAKKIASSDRLIKDPDLLRTWRTVLKAVSAVEMESAGVYIPCQRANVPVLAIRGISDIVGWKRDEAWTLYACHTAAAYARMLVEVGAFCSESAAKEASTWGVRNGIAAGDASRDGSPRLQLREDRRDYLVLMEEIKGLLGSLGMKTDVEEWSHERRERWAQDTLVRLRALRQNGYLLDHSQSLLKIEAAISSAEMALRMLFQDPSKVSSVGADGARRPIDPQELDGYFWIYSSRSLQEVAEAYGALCDTHPEF